MNFKIEDIINNTLDGISQDTLSTVISEIFSESNDDTSNKATV